MAMRLDEDGGWIVISDLTLRQMDAKRRFVPCAAIASVAKNGAERGFSIPERHSLFRFD